MLSSGKDYQLSKVKSGKVTKITAYLLLVFKILYNFLASLYYIVQKQVFDKNTIFEYVVNILSLTEHRIIFSTFLIYDFS